PTVRRYSHADLLGAARRVVGDEGLTDEATVALRAPLSHPGTVVAGVVAPLLAGGTILLSDGDETGDVAVATESPPEAQWISAVDAAPSR
ncbi:MAG: acetyl-CoA synthetase, partial [Halobacteriota archaeon]